MVCWTRFSQLALVLALALAPAGRARAADPMRDFIMSCSYGALAGTLVGAAGLAFTDRPGDNLNLVARGASIGLYAGIFLGLYVVYGAGEGGAEEEIPGVTSRVHFLPLLSAQRGLEGAQLELSLARF